MSKEIIAAVRELEEAKGIDGEVLLTALEDALLAAYKKTPRAAAHARMNRRVQFLVLLQLAENGTATVATTAVVCEGSDRRDLEAALEHLVDDGSIQGPACHLSSLVALAEDGQMKLTRLGRRRLDKDDI